MYIYYIGKLILKIWTKSKYAKNILHFLRIKESRKVIHSFTNLQLQGKI